MIRQSTCVSWSPRRFFIPALILLTFSVLFLSQPACAQTTIVGSNITQDATWSGPVQVTAAISLAAGVRLTIQPGTSVNFEPGTGIDCLGQMLSLGDAANPVTFTSSAGQWRGLRFLANDLRGPSELWNTIIENGGTLGGSVIVDNALVIIRGGEIRLGVTDGVHGFAKGTADISDTLITEHPGYALHFIDPSIDPVLARLQATNNGANVIALTGGGGGLGGNRLWENAGLPYEILGTGFTVAQNETLTVEPGVTVRFTAHSSLLVGGRLIAAGTPAQPIIFTGISPTPGYWRGIDIIGSFASPAFATISFAVIEYGGAGLEDGNLQVENAEVAVQYSRIQNGGSYGVRVANGGLPSISYSHIVGNVLGGIKTLRADIQVPALNNWWGDASGPFHPSSNPGGLGNSVSDNVLYNPWLTDPLLAGPEATPPVELQVQVLGRANYAPGSRQTYAISYRNGTAETISNAVLVVWLPGVADFRTSTGGGIYWPQRDQVFWRLGDLMPGTAGIVAATVEYQWGLPFGTSDALLAVLAGSNAPPNLFRLNDYLSYTPPTVTSRQELTPAQMTALVQGNAEAAARYHAAVQAGYHPAYGVTTQRSDGVTITELNLLRPVLPLTFQTIYISASGVTARTLNSDRYTLETGSTVLRHDRQVHGWQIENAGAGKGNPVLNTSMTFGGCMKNCVQEMLESKIVDKALPVMAIAEKIADCVAAVKDPQNNDSAVLQCGKQIGKKIPGIGDAVGIGTDLGVCNVDCQGDPNSHVCTKDKYECNNEGIWYGLTGRGRVIVYKCNTATGRYFAGETQEWCVPTYGTFLSKCVMDDAGNPHCPSCPTTSRPDIQSTRSELRLAPATGAGTATSYSLAAVPRQNVSCPSCSLAHDPNAKLGVEGLVAPGQTLTYTVQFENMGAGAAFGVFVLDTLASEFDLATLSLGGLGQVVPGSRTILWNVGELAPKGQPGSKGEFTFSVKLRSNLPAGTVVVNQAEVHFPSVPEITPTNAVVNTVQPLIGIDQHLQSVLGQPVAFQLSGFSATGGALAFQVFQPPSFGTLSGTPPNLTYTPPAKFAGEDHLYFTVSKGVETSQPAQVLVDLIGYWLHLPLVVR